MIRVPVCIEYMGKPPILPGKRHVDRIGVRHIDCRDSAGRAVSNEVAIIVGQAGNLTDFNHGRQ